MPEIALNARFDSLQDAEAAATEIRSLFGVVADIRTLSENQSFRASEPMNFTAFYGYPTFNTSSSIPAASAVPAGNTGTDYEHDGGNFSPRSYVMEAQLEEEDYRRAVEIAEKYGADLI